jgi:hypothetical protein
MVVLVAPSPGVKPGDWAEGDAVILFGDPAP